MQNSIKNRTVLIRQTGLPLNSESEISGYSRLLLRKLALFSDKNSRSQ